MLHSVAGWGLLGPLEGEGRRGGGRVGGGGGEGRVGGGEGEGRESGGKGGWRRIVEVLDLRIPIYLGKWST